MAELEGRSGVRHRFSEVETSSVPEGLREDTDLIVESVADILDSVATVTEVLALYAKAYDVGAEEVTLEAPSFDAEAQRLAAEYGVLLRKK